KNHPMLVYPNYAILSGREAQDCRSSGLRGNGCVEPSCKTTLEGLARLVKGALAMGEFRPDPNTLIRIENLKNVFRAAFAARSGMSKLSPGLGGSSEAERSA